MRKIQIHFPCLVSSQSILNLLHVIKEALGIELYIEEGKRRARVIDIAGAYKYVTLGSKNKFNLSSIEIVVKTWAVMEKLYLVDVLEVK